MAYRLWPSTNGPASSTDNENLSYGIAFKVTDTGMVLQGYWYWRADSTAPASATFALWQITGAGTGTYLGSSTLRSTSTMVAGQWNYIPLATPYALTANTPYKAAVWINGTHNAVGNQFGTGQPYAAGITNGPLVAYSSTTGSNPDPYGDPQCTLVTAGQPSGYPATGYSNLNEFLDPQVDYATTAVSGADTGSGADTAVSVAVSDADTGTGADSGTVPGIAAGADTGSGADSGTVAVAVAGSDTAAGAGTGDLGVQTTTTGATFTPVVELTGGSTATVTWSCAGFGSQTGVSPSFSFGSAATRTVAMTVTGGGGYADVVTFNLGYDNVSDAGTYMPAAGYVKAAESVSGISGIGKLTGLIRFLADHTALASFLDFTGLTALQYVQCYQADVTGVTLTGCTALIRLCLEQDNLTTLDLNPVAGNLYDLRAAAQQGGTLTFTTLTAPMAVLYHFCIRGDSGSYRAVNIPAPAQLPVVLQYWTWEDGLSGAFTFASSAINYVLSYQNSYTSADVTGQFPSGRSADLDLHSNLLTSVTLTGCDGLTVIDLHDNRLGQAAVDSILGAAAGWGTSGGTIDLTSNTAPSGTGTGYASTLTGRGWTVSVDVGSGVASGADTAAGDGTGSVAVAVAGSDTGAGADSGTTGAPVSGSDTGGGADSGSVAAAFTAVDTGGAADTGAVAAVLSGADTAAGADRGSDLYTSQHAGSVALAFFP